MTRNNTNRMLAAMMVMISYEIVAPPSSCVACSLNFSGGGLVSVTTYSDSTELPELLVLDASISFGDELFVIYA